MSRAVVVDDDEKIHMWSEDKKIGGQSTAGVQPLMPSILARELEREEIWHGKEKEMEATEERERRGKTATTKTNRRNEL